jgi:hypothetical protein
VNLYDPDILRAVTAFSKLFYGKIAEAFLERVPPDVDAAFDINFDKEGKKWIVDYYLVRHDKRTLFWLQELDASPTGVHQFTTELAGLREMWHLSE